MSAVLFRISFPESLMISDEESLMADVIFGRVVQQCIRACDSGYRIGDDEVLLIMPDTPSSGSKIVVARIYSSFKRATAVECPNLSRAKLEFVDRDYIGGNDLPPYGKLLDEMSVEFFRKNQGQGSPAGK
jgi:hypothetical protein